MTGDSSTIVGDMEEDRERDCTTVGETDPDREGDCTIVGDMDRDRDLETDKSSCMVDACTKKTQTNTDSAARPC